MFNLSVVNINEIKADYIHKHNLKAGSTYAGKPCTFAGTIGITNNPSVLTSECWQIMAVVEIDANNTAVLYPFGQKSYAYNMQLAINGDYDNTIAFCSVK
jgi:hypothetical protein